MQIDIVRPENLTQTQVDRWAALQAAQPCWHSPFLSPWWARSVAKAQGSKANAKVAILRDGGEAVGFMAAKVGAMTAMPVGAPMCDYQGMVTAPCFGTPGLRFGATLSRGTAPLPWALLCNSRPVCC